MSELKYTKGYKYRQEENYCRKTNIIPPKNDIVTFFITLKHDGTLILRPGYACDGPSGLTIDTRDFMRGAFEHDAFYKLMRMSLLPLSYRKAVDKELYRVIRMDGMGWIRASYVYFFVRIFGRSSTLPKNKKKVFTAP